jgi:glycerophosphoryl diester phosphodiesterase
VFATLGVLAVPCGAAANPYVHAHRGGSLHTVKGEQQPRHPENTLPAFKAAARAGYVLELDVKLTSDGVPVVIHDAALDRTTNCAGAVADITAGDLRSRCRVDVLGTAGTTRELRPRDPRRVPVPTLAQALSLARRHAASVNVEVKNIPTEPDFDVSSGFAEAVAGVVRASGFPPSRLIVQSFWPLNLDVFEEDSYFAAAETSLLTLRDPPLPLNHLGPAFARARGYEWVSPQWPIDATGVTNAAYVAEAHALGLRVVPFTLDTPADVSAAAGAGVDAVITNDPRMARATIARTLPPRPRIPPPPSAAECAQARAERTMPPIEAYSPEPGAPRVFAVQFKQELRHVRSYAAFRTKIECMIRSDVVSRLAERRPNVIAMNEDVGLMTLATGSRGALTRAIFENPAIAPSCEQQGIPCGVLGALGAMAAGYAPQLAAYAARFAPLLQPLSATFVAATDTFARGWMQVFSDMARRYDLYIVGSNNQSPFRESVDPSEIDLFADPDRPRPDSVFVATSAAVYNEVFMWGPRDVRREGPWPLRNVVAQNRKVPLTPIEETIQLAPGASTGPDALENLRPYRLPGTRARVGFATSLPAFIYGHDIGTRPPIAPCSNTAVYYMQCMDQLGVNLVIQDEANPGRWAGAAGEGTYQPLEWMRSTWRAVADPSAGFAYNVTPHMVGNLADLAFDGQTAITQRGLRGTRRCTYVGNTSFQPGAPENDPARLRPYAGRKREFLALAPWVVPDGPRGALRERARELAPGSGSPLENDYLETMLVADLPFPPDPTRRNCVGVRR